MILDELSKKDSKWRAYALKITQDESLADDLVQDMYLKYHRNNNTRTDETYIYFTLLNLYRDYLRKSNIIIDLDVIKETIGVYDDLETNEVEQFIKDKLSDYNEYYSELALINADGTSLREIERLYGVNYGTAYYQIKKIKEYLRIDKEVKEMYYKKIK